MPLGSVFRCAISSPEHVILEGFVSDLLTYSSVSAYCYHNCYSLDLYLGYFIGCQRESSPQRNPAAVGCPGHERCGPRTSLRCPNRQNNGPEARATIFTHYHTLHDQDDPRADHLPLNNYIGALLRVVPPFRSTRGPGRDAGQTSAQRICVQHLRLAPNLQYAQQPETRQPIQCL